MSRKYRTDNLFLFWKRPAQYLAIGVAFTFFTIGCSIDNADDFKEYKSDFEKIVDAIKQKHPIGKFPVTGVTMVTCNEGLLRAPDEICDEALSALMEKIGVSQISANAIHCQFLGGPVLKVDFMAVRATNISSPRVITYSECDDAFQDDSNDTEVRQLATHWYLKIGQDPF